MSEDTTKHLDLLSVAGLIALYDTMFLDVAHGNIADRLMTITKDEFCRECADAGITDEDDQERLWEVLLRDAEETERLLAAVALEGETPPRLVADDGQSFRIVGEKDAFFAILRDVGARYREAQSR